MANMLFKGKQLIVLLVIFVQGVVSYSDMCRDAVVPPSKPRGVNQVDRTSSTPMFDLRVTPTQIQEGSGELKGYNVGVSIEDGKHFRFSEATLAVSTDGSCGSGDFDFRIGDYVEIVQDQEEKCPRLLQTKKKTHMTELLPLIWIPPSCGCVTLRILLIESGEIYYAENEGVTNGPLAKTFCFQQKEEQKQITREHRLDSLCHVIDRHSSSEILSRSQFRRYRGLESKHMDHLGIELALELRRNDAKACCQMIQFEDKMMCFDNARRRRIDQFCEDGIPDIPFKTFRKSHMRTLEKSCCFILGEFRYKCFETNSAISARLDDTTLFDYSMDASDLANDLAEFGSHENLDSFLRPKQYRDDESNDDDDDDEEEDVWSDEEFDLEDDDDDDRELIKTPKSRSTVSPMDLKKLLRKPNIRNSKISSSERMNNRRVSSTERKVTRGGGSRRKSGRRGSAERRKNAGRRGSAERRGRVEGYGSVERRNSAERRSSAERRGTYIRRGSTERRTSAERRKSAERRGSAERRERLRKVSRGTFDDRYTSTDRDSFYGQPRFDDTKTRDIEKSKFTNARGGARQPMPVDEDRYGFDDQGGSSMDRTLLKLQKRMKRIKLLNMCCQAGADMGRQVYGGIGSVTDECRHSSDKFVRGVNLGGKTRKCAGQFVDCCLEEAKKGLTMTSQEFIENSPVNYWDSPQQYDPRLVGQVLAQRGRRPALPSIPDTRRQTTQPKIYKDSKTNYRTMPDERKSTPDRHVGSVKGEKSTLHPLRTLPKTQDIDAIRSQQPAPNSNSVQSASGVSNNQVLSIRDEQKSTEKQETRGLGIPKKTFDKTDKRVQVVEDTPTGKDTKNLRKPVLKRVVFVESKALPAVQQQNRKSSEAKRPIQNQRKEIKMEDFMDNVGDENLKQRSNTGGLSKANRQPTIDNSPKQKQQINIPAKAEPTDKPAKENIGSRKPTTETNMISKKSHSGHAIFEERKVTSNDKPRNSHLYESSTQSNIPTSGQIVTREYFDEYKPTGTRGKQSRRNRFNGRSKGQRRRKAKSRVVALDSREMAERNAKQYMDALDSREMADQFISRNNKNRRWYRKNTRNYRYPMPYLGKHNRRTRFG